MLWLVIALVLVGLTSAASNPLSVPSSDAPAYCQNYNPVTNPKLGMPVGTVSYGNIMGPAVSLSVMALMISFAVVAIALILSSLFPHMGIRNWLQSEYWEITKSAIIIVVIFSMLSIVGNVAYAFAPSGGGPITGGNITPLINSTELYLCNVNYNMMDVWSWVGLIGSGSGFWSNVKLGSYFAVPVWDFFGIVSGSVFVPFNNWMLQTGNPMIAAYGSIIGDAINFLIFPFTVILLILVYVLPTMTLIGLTFFVPLGIVLRAFPFIRGIGGTMIAIGIGMSIVLPGVLIILNSSVTNYISQAVAFTPPPLPSPTGFGSFISSCPFMTAFVLVGPSFCTTVPVTTSALPNLLSTVAYSASNDQVGQYNGANVFSDTAIYQYMDILMSMVPYVLLQLVLITIDLVVVYAITDSIARAMGGSIRFQLGGKLRISS